MFAFLATSLHFGSLFRPSSFLRLRFNFRSFHRPHPNCSPYPAWQSQETDTSNSADGISMPAQDVQAEYTNGNGAPPRASRSRSPVDRDRARSGTEPDADNPGNNLHVSGLHSRVDNRELESAFAKVGRVEKVSVVYDPHTRDSRLFGFVTMESREEADAAIAALNGTELMGKVITVVRARRGRARTPTPGRYHGPSKRRPRDRPYEVRPYDSTREAVATMTTEVAAAETIETAIAIAIGEG
ncbi:RNA-binding domain-containing protein [Gymnopus androsaceus JB14]|uniref:RNA-binding domain-containing protein n=1 Tax=Gymnopus androsaceus JB14 TaxID=1447944 RepID=A0A6A4HAA0_9AGAR|nr:RNA-binding domain-containing protein [Gymnopus androsaceus JB14]